ncbi:Oligopeptidase A [Morus notabilis]|uniref:Oligopeptidase A n=1 Tax=Morus notabilis TaxID=981085 RepID=W9QGZ9_9ROSA|nr:Oligopeptidase A [Morus notabilis]
MAMGRRGKVESAIGDLDRAVELSPENARAFCLLEECYEAKKMEAEVRKAYEDALRIEPELALAREALDRLVSMATKMANVEKAEELLEKLRSASWDAVVQDMEDLKDFSKKQGASEADDLNHWDISFWSERLPRVTMKKKITEELRPYFSLPKVMDGLFNLAKTLFGIEIKPANGLAPVWNKDVRFYCVKDSSANPIAYFYFDPYTRPSEKRGGAWMDEVVSRSRVLSRNDSESFQFCWTTLFYSLAYDFGSK